MALGGWIEVVMLARDRAERIDGGEPNERVIACELADEGLDRGGVVCLPSLDDRCEAVLGK